MTDLKGKRVLVTGGAGFLGQRLIRRLEDSGYENIHSFRSSQYDITRETNVERLYRDIQPEIVIHLAAIVGGIGANRAYPGRFLYENLVMGAMLMEHGRRSGVEKFVVVGSVCSYPKFASIPFREEELWDGYPEETNAPYGLAKKMLLVQGQAYRRQYGFNAIHLLPANLYGPGDNFDSENSHVIPALIVKCFDALTNGEQKIVCWGDGTATREFLYVEDCAEAILLAVEQYNGVEPVNVGAGFEISIKDLVELITELTGFKGRIEWDATKPNGQLRRKLDTTRAREAFGFQASTDFRTGLSRVVESYRESMMKQS